MRELKFRVWDKIGNLFLPDFTLSKYGKLILSWSASHTQTPENFAIQQFTGLLDKNKKEIYEGDRIRVCYTMDEHGDIHTYDSVVVFDHGAFGDAYDIFFNYEFLPSFRLEVIGHVYEGV